MTKSIIFRILVLSFLSGIAAGSFYQEKFLIFAYFIFLLAIIAFFIFYKNKKALLAVLISLFFLFGVWRVENKLEEIKNQNRDGESISALAVVKRDPEQKENFQNIVAEIDDKIVILLRGDSNENINYGDELKIECVLSIPEKKENEKFDYRMYLAKEKIHYLCRNSHILKTGEKKGNKVYTFILQLKNKMKENINQHISYPYSTLANGLLFGGSGELPKTLKENFSRTGLTHIVAVSGFNVTIIAEYLVIFGIIIGLWKKQAFWLAVGGIFLFVAMIGFPSSAVRAGVMGCLLIWAMKNGRLANSWNAIFFAAACMLIFNPLLLRWDIGFQLSFLATIGIVACSPFFEKYAIKKNRAFGFMEIIFLTISAQIFVLPIILSNFHQFSWVFLISNILVLPIIPLTMLLSFLTAISGFIWSEFALIFSWLTFLLLKYEVWIANVMANTSWSVQEVKNFGWQGVVFWYLILGLIYFMAIKRRWIFPKTENNSVKNDT